MVWPRRARASRRRRASATARCPLPARRVNFGIYCFVKRAGGCCARACCLSFLRACVPGKARFSTLEGVVRAPSPDSTSLSCAYSPGCGCSRNQPGRPPQENVPKSCGGRLDIEFELPRKFEAISQPAATHSAAGSGIGIQAPNHPPRGYPARSSSRWRREMPPRIRCWQS